MTCEPSYTLTYAPTVRPLPASSAAPIFAEHRSRLFAGGTYFRSLSQSVAANSISLEITVAPSGPNNVVLTVSVLNVPQESFVITQTPPIFPATVCSGGISALRSAVNNLTTGSAFIEMFTRGADIEFDLLGTDAIDNCVVAFPDTSMGGGSGGPSNASQPFLDSIFTGEQRTIIMISTTEDLDGVDIFPPPSRRIQQYDGTNFISYCNDVQGACPLEGTC